MYSASWPIATEPLANARHDLRRCENPENELLVDFGTDGSLATLHRLTGRAFQANLTRSDECVFWLKTSVLMQAAHEESDR
jgi:hypothetical protein